MFRGFPFIFLIAQPSEVLSASFVIVISQFCLMEHYFESPLSVLCSVSVDSRNDILDQLSHKQVEMFRKTISFRR